MPKSHFDSPQGVETPGAIRSSIIEIPWVHNAFMTMSEDGWISYGEGDNSHLTDEQRKMIEERITQRDGQRGGLLGVVVVSVYEHGCHTQVNFPDESLLGVETDASVISEMVTRASAELANWS